MLGAHFFWQISEEELTRAQTVAGMLEICLAHAVGIAVIIKRAAIRVSGVEGAIPAGDPAAWCAAQVAWPQADAPRLFSALLAAGHVVATAGPQPGHEVAFLEPVRAMKKTSKLRSDAGKRGAEVRKVKGGYGRATAGPQPGESKPVARDGKKDTETHSSPPTEERPTPKQGSFAGLPQRESAISIALEQAMPRLNEAWRLGCHDVGREPHALQEPPPTKTGFNSRLREFLRQVGEGCCASLRAEGQPHDNAATVAAVERRIRIAAGRLRRFPDDYLIKSWEDFAKALADCAEPEKRRRKVQGGPVSGAVAMSAGARSELEQDFLETAHGH